MTITRSRTGTLDPRLQMTEAEISAAAISVVPEVARKPSGDNLGLFAGLAGALLLGGITFYGLSSGRDAPVEPKPAPAPVAAATKAPAPVVAPPAPVPMVMPAPVTAPAVDPQAEAEQLQRLRAPALVVDSSVAVPDGDAARAPGAAGRGGLSRDEQFASRVGAVEASSAKATRMASPGTTVPQGAMIPAVLETAINTDLPGFARAVVTEDVRSFDGSRVLIPRGSRVVGQYRGGLQVGQRRAYVIWSRLLRPDGVSVALSSPGTDDLGQTGLTGDVDTHFFSRFGSALLLSVVGGLANSAGGSGAVVIGAGGVQDASSTALSSQASISPTVKVRQGEPIRIFTARDLDFSTVEPK